MNRLFLVVAIISILGACGGGGGGSPAPATTTPPTGGGTSPTGSTSTPSISAAAALQVGAGPCSSSTSKGWCAVNQLAAATTLTSIAVDSASTLWVTGDNGVVAVSTDAGQSWNESIVASGAYLSDIVRIDASTLVTVGLTGAIARSTNNGATWATVVSGTTLALYSVAATSGLALAVGENVILRSTDGGASWQNVVLPSTGSIAFLDLSQVTIVNSSTAWAVGTVNGSGGYVFKSSDGGQTWQSQAPQTFATSWAGILAIDANNLVVVGSVTACVGSAPEVVGPPCTTGTPEVVGTMLFTADGGTTWTQEFTNSTSSFASIALNTETSPSSLVAVGTYGQIYESSIAGAGAGWTERINPTSQGTTFAVTLHAAGGFQGGPIWVVGDGPTVLERSAGSGAWNNLYLWNKLEMASMAASGTSGVWAIDQIGDVLSSSDGGVTWVDTTSQYVNPKPCSAQTPQPFQFQVLCTRQFAVGASGATSTWVVGQNGVIGATTDGGTTWTDLTPTTVSLDAISVLDANTLFAAGSGAFLASTNGGSTWTSRSAPSTLTNSVSAYDANNIYASSSLTPGTLSSSHDGGVTWSTWTAATGTSIYGVQALGQNIAVGVGSSGSILRTKDGGATWTLATIPATSPVSTITLTAVSSPDGKTVVAVGQGVTTNSSGNPFYSGAVILRSADAGITWALDASGLPFFPTAAATSQQGAWATGTNRAFTGSVMYRYVQ